MAAGLDRIAGRTADGAPGRSQKQPFRCRKEAASAGPGERESVLVERAS